MNKFTFHYVNDVYRVTIPIYICFHLSNGALFGECISRKKLRSFFISKLTEFSFKNWNSRGLEWWYRSDEAGRYITGIRADRTFLASELWVYCVFLFILWLACWMLDVCCLELELTHFVVLPWVIEIWLL